MLSKRLGQFIVSLGGKMSKRCKLEQSDSPVLVQSASISARKGLAQIDSPDMNSLNRVIYLPPPTKSPNDKKHYSVIELPNGLTALLISDPHNLVNMDQVSESSDSGGESSSDAESVSSATSINSLDPNKKIKTSEVKMAACALSIGVGSFSDPEDIPGLAHFLEHMVFMGSKKYPKENEFDSFIKKKGGTDNATTECEYTTFYFECHDQHLKRGLDMFSQFFISPLMKREAMTRERESIESEFQMSLPSDAYRKQQILCTSAHANNPARKFHWGNLITLRDNVTDDYLHESVHKFWERHYSAHRMKLAVQARLPLKTLEDWVIEHFSLIPSNHLSPINFDVGSCDLFQKDLFCNMYIVESVKDICEVDISWVMPPVLHLYKAKPTDYLSWLFGHEGKGSLISYLRKNLWALDISAGHGDDGVLYNSLYTMFSITINLTEKGYSEINKVLNAVFSYIKMVQMNGPEERLFKEIQQMQNINFKYSEESPPADYVENMSENMHFFPPEDYITGGSLYVEYKPQVIREILNFMTPSSANIIISSKKPEQYHLDKVEPWFKTRYTCIPIPEMLLNELNNVQPYPEFHTPEPNPFIPTDFSLLPGGNINVKYPEKIRSDEMIEVYYKQDAKFNLPLGYIYSHLISPMPFKSAKHAVLQDLFITISKQLLVEEIYPANMAQLELDLNGTERGLIIGVSGFNEKLHLLLDKVLKLIVTFNENVYEDIFQAMKKELSRQYKNSTMKPGSLCREIRMKLLLKTCWTTVEKYNALIDIKLEDVIHFFNENYKYIYLQCLIQGNISKENAVITCENTIKTLKCEPLNRNEYPEIQVYEMPRGETCCRVNSFNLNDANSVTVNYYQLGPGNIKEYCLIELLLMLMEEPMFDKLRTQEQLGYDVSCILRDTFGVLGFSVAVVSQINKYSVEHVESRITNFLKKFVLDLKKMPIQDFDETVTSLIKLKQCGDIYLKEEVKRHWDEIKSFEYVFDRMDKEIAYISKFSLDNIIDFFSEQIGVKKTGEFKKLMVQVVGNENEKQSNEILNNFTSKDCDSNRKIDFHIIKATSPVKDVVFVSDIYNFNKTLRLYPPNKIVE